MSTLRVVLFLKLKLFLVKKWKFPVALLTAFTSFAMYILQLLPVAYHKFYGKNFRQLSKFRSDHQS